MCRKGGASRRRKRPFDLAASVVTGSSARVYHRAGRRPDPLADDDSGESLFIWLVRRRIASRWQDISIFALSHLGTETGSVSGPSSRALGRLRPSLRAM